MNAVSKTLWCVMGVAGALGLVSGRDAVAAVEPQASATIPEIWGTIIAVDPTRNALTLEHQSASAERAQRTEFRIDDGTIISKAGVRLQPADLQAGEERLAIQYATEGSTVLARTITFEEPSGLLRASGTVDRFDVLKGELMVQPKGLLSGKEPKTFSLTERSILSHGGTRTYLANLMAGDEVDIQYANDNDQAVVYALTVTARKGDSLEVGTPR